MKNQILFHRLFWSCVYFTLVSYTIIMVVSLLEQFIIHPTVTSLISSTYPVNKIPFPAIAVCNINKVNKERARKFARRIANMTKRNPEEVLNFTHHLGELHDFDFEPTMLPTLLEFQNLLDTLGISVIDAVKEIATPCEVFLRTCFWRSVEVDCSTIFKTELTHHGYCCVFNHVVEDTDALTTDAGIENGLYVSTNVNVLNYDYTLLSSYGAIVSVFVPTDYPDKSSGGLTEVLTQPNSQNYIEIVPTTLISVNDVAHYPVATRECLFAHEQLTGVQHIYSQSGCNVECRMKSVYAMCQCIPFMVPSANRSNVCTLADIPCLNRYKTKWSTLFPDKGNLGGHLARERHDSLLCDKKCYSPCTETRYAAVLNSFPVFNSDDKDNVTRIHLYYLNRFSNLYQQDIVYYWFEALSNFGGIFGIFVGWSLISILALVIQCAKIVNRRVIIK